MKRLVADLRPSVLDRIGLPEALARLAEESSERSDMRVKFSSSLPEGLSTSEEDKTALYRVAKESLTNALRYSKCASIRLSLEVEEGKVALEVADDGVGFDPSAIAREAPKSFGLIGMRERCRALGGEFRVSSAPGSGTSVRATIPIR
jgi:signal transduction histidine kinase